MACCDVILWSWSSWGVHTENLNSHLSHTVHASIPPNAQQTLVTCLSCQVCVCTSTPWWRVWLAKLPPRHSWASATATPEPKSSSMSTGSTTWSSSPLLCWISWTKISTLSPCVSGRVHSIMPMEKKMIEQKMFLMLLRWNSADCGQLCLSLAVTSCILGQCFVRNLREYTINAETQ